MKSLLVHGMLAIGLAGLTCGRAEAGFVLTANAAGSQASTVAGVTTESFDEITAGRYTSLTTAVGTLSSPGMQVLAANQFGGAGGTGNYFAIGSESGQTSATLTLNGAQSYFGFWWSAADAQNSIEFLSKGQVVAEFNPTSALNSLGSAYVGNPNNGEDPNEKFAYLNFIGTGGSTFDQVVFLNNNLSTGFESDNWSTLAGEPATDPGTPIGGVTIPVPAPSSLALTASAIGGLLTLARLRRKA